jgi:hypothetical protein
MGAIAPGRRVRALSLSVTDLLVLALCLAAFVGAAWVSTTVFDRLPHVEDDVAFLFQAKVIASGHLRASPSPLPDFFGIPFILVRDGHWFGKYPPGYPLVLALGVLVGQPWLQNPAAGAVAIGLVYLAGRRLYGRWTGVLAAALLAASPFFLLQAGSFLSHTVTLCWALAFLLLFERARRTGSIPSAVAGGAALGMLFLSRPLTAVGIGIPYVIWAGIESAIAPRRMRVYLPMALGFLPFVGMMLGYNRLTTGDPFRFAYELWWPFDKVGFGPGHGPGDTGHTLASGQLNTRINVDQLRQYLFGWPDKRSLVPAWLGGIGAFVGLTWRLLRRAAPILPAPPRTGTTGVPAELWDLLNAGVVVSLIAIHLTYWTAGQMYGPRYYFEAIGALVLLSARGILVLVPCLGPLLRRLAPSLPAPAAWAAFPTLLVVAYLTLWSFTNFVPPIFRGWTDWYQINGDGVRKVDAANIHHAVVFVQIGNWTDYAPFFCQNTPSLDTDVVYAIDLGDRDKDLMRLYPGRSFYRYSKGVITPIPTPAPG